MAHDFLNVKFRRLLQKKSALIEGTFEYSVGRFYSTTNLRTLLPWLPSMLRR